ncbi:ArsR family transcriptional regulator [candidate division KSB1 bacterium]|nr:MAG: ArsR family transcriptional regulator [candidate division KSB1 bacterium]
MYDPAAVFRALADPTRLQMVALITRYREVCVCELEGVLKITQSKASRHLRYLLHSGILADRREGVSVYYRFSESLPREYGIIVKQAVRLIGDDELAVLNREFDQFRACRCSSASRVKHETAGLA